MNHKTSLGMIYDTFGRVLMIFENMIFHDFGEKLVRVVRTPPTYEKHKKKSIKNVD